MPADARSEALRALAGAGSNPFMRSFPEGAVFTWDQELRYLSAGGRGLAEVGLSREMMEGHTIFEVFPHNTAAAIEPFYRAALRGEATTTDVLFGGHIYSQRLAPVLDGDGNIVAGMGFTHDVTSAREAENALRESEERARLSFEHAPIGQALVELDGRWRQVNAALTRLTGYPESQLLGMTFQDITHPDDLDADLEQVEQLLAGTIDSYQMEKRYITAAGATVWVLLAGSVVRNPDGSPLYFIAQIQDITPLKRQHEAMEDLMAMLAHDLRTPLTSVVGFAELLTTSWDSVTDAKKLEFLTRITNSSSAMEKLLEDTLTVSTIEAHALNARPTAVPIQAVVHEVLDLLDSGPESIDLAGLGPHVAWVDRGHLSQIVTNLLTNAVKYGKGEIHVRSHAAAGAVGLQVCDHGPGIAPEFVPHVFDRFTRVDDAHSRITRGTGLGLYIVHSLVTANHGRISYTDTPGGGATFTLTLPSPPTDG